jgi:predicted RNA binding protein YcfA (HicA-like mRNA interferase family)
MTPDKKLPRIRGKQLIKLVAKDGWILVRRTRHGVSLSKKFGDRAMVTIIPDSRAELDEGTLSAIIGPKQMGIGKQGILNLIEKYGL